MPRVPTKGDNLTTATDDSMKQYWETRAKQKEQLEEERKKLEEHMRDAGVEPVKLYDDKNDRDDQIARLNVGGLHFDVPYSVSPEIVNSSRILSALLLGIWKNERVPRDSSGRLFVDASHELYTEFLEVAVQYYKSLAKSATPYSLLTGHDAPVSRPAPQKGDAAEVQTSSMLKGLSTVLGRGDRESLYQLLRDGCPKEPQKLKLLYRASSRPEANLSAASFHSKCDDAANTITLVKVSNISPARESIVGGYASASLSGEQSQNIPEAAPEKFSIVGGFSDVSWSGEGSPKESAAAFIFMLRDESGHQTASHEHATKWGIKKEKGHTPHRPRAVFCDRNSGPTFGSDELRVYLSKDSSPDHNTGTIACKVPGDGSYEVPEKLKKAYTGLDGRSILDIEVYTVETWGGAKPTQRRSPSYATPGDVRTTSSSGETGGMDSWKASTFECIRPVVESLQRAEDELAQLARESDKLGEAVQTMTELYGPGNSKNDEVVDLIVGGTRMSTLRSTLEVCGGTILSALVKKGRKRRVGLPPLDCDPECFAKLLEVLRSKKRVSSAGSQSGAAGEKAFTATAETIDKGTSRTGVVVDAAKRVCFEELVKKYLHGHEKSIMKSVSFSSGH